MPTRDRNPTQIDSLVSIYPILRKPVLPKNREPNPHRQLLEPPIAQLEGQRRYIAGTPELDPIRFLLVIPDTIVDMLYCPGKVPATGHELLQSTLGVFELRVPSLNRISRSNLAKQRNKVSDPSCP